MITSQEQSGVQHCRYRDPVHLTAGVNNSVLCIMKATLDSCLNDKFSIDEKFQAAVEIVHSLPKEGSVKTSIDEKLAFYSLYKQATIGPCNTCQPRFWNIVEKTKWDSWNNLGTMESTEAKKITSVAFYEWKRSELYNQLEPKLVILGLRTADCTSRNYDPVSENEVHDTVVHEVPADNKVILEGGCSDVEYTDAREEQYFSRVCSPTDDIREPKALDHKDSELRKYATPQENEYKISCFTIAEDSRYAKIRHLFQENAQQCKCFSHFYSRQ
ncbi:hypothetical protein KIN20_008415 [Parelaphostrongylus tenuis]|uniref:ACB domain-containing protein n=1 Tax=Parelaphostrongylus tenuis TaxID=148309 RepID=A0AAD5QJU2_PARTN|nr:hypothetical protein KIN20_008415 [Parelaphostrongylus tenuis]